MTNAHAAGVDYIGDNGPSGQSLGKSATELAGMHGTVSAQISNITIVSDSYTNSATQLLDNLIVAVNAIIAAQTQKGIVAAS